MQGFTARFLVSVLVFASELTQAAPIFLTLTRWYGTYPCVSEASAYGARIYSSVGPTGITVTFEAGDRAPHFKESFKLGYARLEHAPSEENKTILRVATEAPSEDQEPAYIVLDEEAGRFVYSVTNAQGLRTLFVCGNLDGLP